MRTISKKWKKEEKAKNQYRLRLALIAMPIYNSWPVVEKSLAALLKYATDSNIFLIYNHPPENILAKVRSMVKRKGNVILLIPPTNYGVTRSLNWAFSHGTNDHQILFKIDDDTIVCKGFVEKMTKAIKTFDNVAFVCASSNAEQANESFTIQERGGISLKLYSQGCLSFSCMAIGREKYELLGEMSADYRIFKDGKWEVIKGDRLYGGEEAYYAKRAREENLLMGKLGDVYVYHQDNEEKDIDYVVWKHSYGYFGTVNCSLDELKQDKELLVCEVKRLYDFGKDTNNNWYIERARKRLETLGVSSLLRK